MILIYLIFIWVAIINICSGFIHFNQHEFGWATLNYLLASYAITAILFSLKRNRYV